MNDLEGQVTVPWMLKINQVGQFSVHNNSLKYWHSADNRIKHGTRYLTSVTEQEKLIVFTNTSDNIVHKYYFINTSVFKLSCISVTGFLKKKKYILSPSKPPNPNTSISRLPILMQYFYGFT